MTFKRILCLLTALSILFACTSCSAGSPVASHIDENGYFAYYVVKSGNEDLSAEENNAAKEVRAAIRKTFDCNVVFTTDDNEDFDGNREILIGNTLREESVAALNKLKSNRENNASDFIVSVSGDKIVITATTNEMIYTAAQWFIKNFCQSAEDWAKLYDGYEFMYIHGKEEAAPTQAAINGVNIGNYSTVLPKRSSYLITMYAEKLEALYYEDNFLMKQLTDADSETEYEILYGDCNRKESKSVTVEGDNYVIKVIGKKIVVKGGNDLATNTAARHLYTAAYSAIKEGKGFDWSDGHTINGKYDPTNEQAYTLNWNDEFEGSSVDLSKWGDYASISSATASSLGGKMYTTGIYGNTNYYGDDAMKPTSYLSDGNLVLTAQRINEKDFMISQTSTYWTMNYRFGLIEIRSRLPEMPGCSSYWLNGAAVNRAGFVERFGNAYQRTAMTEIDILENFGKNKGYAINIHRWWSDYYPDGSYKGSLHNSMDGNSLYSDKYFDYEGNDTLSDDFHIYSCYWDEECIKFCFDGKLFITYNYYDNNSISIHNLSNYFITGCKMGDATYGITYREDEHPEYVEHIIDYVRVYQTASQDSQMVTAWPQNVTTGKTKVFYPENSLG